MQIAMTERELEIFYMGLMLGKELDIQWEWQTKDSVGFGDFEGINITYAMESSLLDFDSFDNRTGYFAAVGIVHEARREVNRWLGGE